MRSVDINVHYLTRVEGHGHIVVNVKEGRLEECRLEIVEAPRFFEAMLRGRKYDEVAHITSRICGICSIGHTTASLRATEDALGIIPSEQTVLLRKLALHGEILSSHLLHVYFLAAPDLLGVGSVFPLVNTHRDVVLRALRMKKLANDLCDLVTGRKIHPIRMAVNGFTKLPQPQELREMQRRLTDSLPDLEATVELFKTLPLPQFERETEYISLKDPQEYALYGGYLYSSDGVTAKAREYRRMTNEYVVPHSTAKHTKLSRSSYMVGALARVNNNYELLSPLAKKAAKVLGLKVPCYNPFMNNIAQLVESAHCLEDSINLIDKILAKGLKEEERSVEVKAGRGVGAVEVPRGILYHEYSYDYSGAIKEANCIIPTGQNLANIEENMKALLPTILDQPREKITLTLEMLVRAYDPCISCSTHLLEVKFI